MSASKETRMAAYRSGKEKWVKLHPSIVKKWFYLEAARLQTSSFFERRVVHMYGRNNVKDSITFVQSVANLGGARIKVDGISGPATRAAVNRIPSDTIALIEKTLEAHGLPDLKSVVSPSPRSSGSPKHPKPTEGFYKLAEVARRELPKHGLNADFALAQWHMESNGGHSALSRNHHNYGGIKYSSVADWNGNKTPVNFSTREVIDGSGKVIRDDFVSYENEEAFVDSYIFYLLYGRSSYRYNGTGAGMNLPNGKRVTGHDIRNAVSVSEYGWILAENGYATEPADKYGKFLVSRLQNEIYPYMGRA